MSFVLLLENFKKRHIFAKKNTFLLLSLSIMLILTFLLLYKERNVPYNEHTTTLYDGRVL